MTLSQQITSSKIGKSQVLTSDPPWRPNGSLSEVPGIAQEVRWRRDLKLFSMYQAGHHMQICVQAQDRPEAGLGQ